MKNLKKIFQFQIQGYQLHILKNLITFLIILVTVNLINAQILFEKQKSNIPTNEKAIENIAKINENEKFSEIIRVKMKNLRKTQKEGVIFLGLGKTSEKAIAQSVDFSDDENYTWYGLVFDSENNESGSLVIKMTKGKLSGVLISQNIQYFIMDYLETDKSKDKQKFIYLVKQNKQFMDKVICSQGLEIKTDSLQGDFLLETRSCNRNIRVLFLYTQNAADTNFDPNVYADNFITFANLTLTNSGIQPNEAIFQSAGVFFRDIQDRPAGGTINDRAEAILDALKADQDQANSHRNLTAADVVL